MVLLLLLLLLLQSFTSSHCYHATMLTAQQVWKQMSSQTMFGVVTEEASPSLDDP